MEPREPTTHFGYETVAEADKAGRVRGVFASVAGRYDLMNDAMSLGVHRQWKDAMLDWLAPWPGMRLLDVTGGTVARNTRLAMGDGSNDVRLIGVAIGGNLAVFSGDGDDQVIVAGGTVAGKTTIDTGTGADDVSN